MFVNEIVTTSGTPRGVAMKGEMYKADDWVGARAGAGAQGVLGVDETKMCRAQKLKLSGVKCAQSFQVLMARDYLLRMRVRVRVRLQTLWILSEYSGEYRYTRVPRVLSTVTVTVTVQDGGESLKRTERRQA